MADREALSLSEREEIRAGIIRKESLRQLAGRLGRPASTICREVARNGGRQGYRAVAADQRATQQRRRPKTPKLVAHPELAAHIAKRLEKEKVSPWAIAADLRRQGGQRQRCRPR